MRLIAMPSSGNSRKVLNLLRLLAIDCAVTEAEDASPEIAAAKASGALPFGKVPVLHLEDDRAIPESNAILCYLGEGSRFWPADPATRAQMLGWMFWEQNQHEGTIAVRAALQFYPHRRAQATPERMAELLDRGHANLQVMENRLAGRDWLVGEAPSLADICLYGYTHTAGPRGGFDMARFPTVNRWLARVAALPGYRGLEA